MNFTVCLMFMCTWVLVIFLQVFFESIFGTDMLAYICKFVFFQADVGSDLNLRSCYNQPCTASIVDVIL